MSSSFLRVQNLRAGYGRAEVLHGIDLQAAKGSVITVIGPNGAGKSTLLNTLMGILPGRGSIEFDGQPIAAMTLEERVMLGAWRWCRKSASCSAAWRWKTTWCWAAFARCGWATPGGATAWPTCTTCSPA